jgi:hypothetical protein
MVNQMSCESIETDLVRKLLSKLVLLRDVSLHNSRHRVDGMSETHPITMERNAIKSIACRLHQLDGVTICSIPIVLIT